MAKLDMAKALCKQSPPGKTQAHVIPSLARRSIAETEENKEKKGLVLFLALKRKPAREEEGSLLFVPTYLLGRPCFSTS